jgi:hypothetical protein
LRDLVSQADALIGQVLETFEIIDVLLHLIGLLSRNAPAELFASIKALQNVIRALGESQSGQFPGVNLSAQAAPAQPVNGFEFCQEGVAIGGKLVNFVWHDHIVSY